MEVGRVGNLEGPFYTHAHSTLSHRDHKRITESCWRCPPSILPSFQADQQPFWDTVREEEAIRLTMLILPQIDQKNCAIGCKTDVWV